MVLVCTKHLEPMKKAVLHSHKAWEIIYTLSGHVTETFGERKITGDVGTVTVIPPNMVHDCHAEDTFTDMFFQTTYTGFSSPLAVQDRDGSILSLMQLLHRQMLERENNYRAISDALSESICQFIRKYAQSPAENSAVSTLKSILYEHISDADFNLSEAMTSLGYTENYLRSCFRQETGLPPLQYLTKLRIAQAESLLMQADFVSIAHVASECGFSDSLYFSTCFKKHRGESPMQFRMRKLNGE
ncbi:MAG: helix-turn-helix domain-containing protein [Ruminococcaceae bacterium]|nr:helix-turn-helix domain-containing protein [Oscillospiraceae bacterium]